MADVTIEINDNLKEVMELLERATEAALEEVGTTAETYAKQNVAKGVPRHADSWYVPKGAAGLEGSIDHKVNMSEKAVYIGTNNEHAIYNEMGTGIYAEGGGRQSPWAYMGEDGQVHWTRGITPLHFLKKAAEDHASEYKTIIEQTMKGM